MSANWDVTGFRAEVASSLADAVDAHAARLAPLGPDAERLIEQARISLLGGKMFRASFCWWGHHAFAAPVDDDHRRAVIRACAAHLACCF